MEEVRLVDVSKGAAIKFGIFAGIGLAIVSMVVLIICLVVSLAGGAK